jgi:uncharacterized LabA/DUF88 family protein
MNEPSIGSRQDTAIAIFYDGGFAEKIRARSNCPGDFYIKLGSAIQSSARTVLNSKSCSVLASLWFRGVYTTKQVLVLHPQQYERVKFYEEERRLSEQLLESEIEITGRLMQKIGFDFKEKAIDSLLFASAIRCIAHEQPTAIALVAGDGDHVTLLEEARKRGVKTILVWYDEGDVRSSGWLQKRADWSLQLAFNPNLQLLPPQQPEICPKPALRTPVLPAEVVPTPGRPVTP